MEKITAWKCGHCNMTSIHKGSVKRHEQDFCRKNKDRQTCCNCKNLKTEFVLEDEFSFSTWEIFYCDAEEKEMDQQVLNINNNCKSFKAGF